MLPERWRPAVRRGLRAGKRTVRSVRRSVAPPMTVRAVRWDRVETTLPGGLRARAYDLTDPAAGRTVKARRLRVVVPDLPALQRLVTSGLLRGWTYAIDVRVEQLPAELAVGNRLARTGRHTTSLGWARLGPGLRLSMSWSAPRPLERALSDALGGVGRDRRWGSAGGPLWTHDREAWLAGQGTWPYGHLVDRAPDAASAQDGVDPAALGETADAGAAEAGTGATGSCGSPTGPDPDHGEPGAAPLRAASGPLGAFIAPPGAEARPTALPLATSVANPLGRVLRGAPTRYRLELTGAEGSLVLRRSADGGPSRDVLSLSPGRSPERSGGWDKYCTVVVPAALPRTPFAGLALQSLAAAGAVLLVPDERLRRELAAGGLRPLAEPPSSADGPFAAYAASVASAHAATIAGDPVLRWTALAGRAQLPLPTVSVTVASKRPDDVERCLGYLGAQTYPAYEVVLGTHGYVADADVQRRWRELLPVPLRVAPMPAQLSLGECLGRLSRVADGDHVTKVDDDDHYGPDHLTDLVLAARTSGAELVAKSSRFTYFADLGTTLDRAWGAPETFDVTPAGGTMLLPRAALYELGGWSTSVRHVDSDLIDRARAVGALRYRTHSLGYVYVRRSSGHTWAADHDALLGQGEARYAGLPAAVLGTAPVL